MDKFSIEENGYSKREVNKFIDDVIANTESMIKRVKKQQSEISELKEENDTLKNLENENEKLKSENNELRDLLGLKGYFENTPFYFYLNETAPFKPRRVLRYTRLPFAVFLGKCRV